MKTALSPRLRHLVNESVALLGAVLKSKLGTKAYQRIEQVRRRMAHLRRSSLENASSTLEAQFQILKKLTPREQFEFAQSFALMLELMNTCENAYRSREIKKRVLQGKFHQPESVVYVLTAHPTEARSPHNIRVFQEILKILTKVFEREDTALKKEEKELLSHWLEVAWSTSMVRTKKPRVHDEAAHIYSTLLREESLEPLLKAHRELAPIFVHTWVGGDKDGHPGVDEKVFLESLQLSRHQLYLFVRRRLKRVAEILKGVQEEKLQAQLQDISDHLNDLEKIKVGDGRRVLKFKSLWIEFIESYLKLIGHIHPDLRDLEQLFEMFPALVVPLEFRESSEVLMSSPQGRGLAITRMLKELARISRGGDPRWYVRALIVSMAENILHMRTAGQFVKSALGEIYLPIVPLFEQAEAQDLSVSVVNEMLKDKILSRALKTHWKNSLEVMLGYSDSSKERGVLPSRLKVAETMFALDRFCKKKKIKPVFFQGAGGSVDRGGGSIEEQTSWWSSSALKNYKVTIQGEMVERSLANAEITWGQLEQIAFYAGNWSQARHRTLPVCPFVDQFAERVAGHYQNKVASPEFLNMVEKATPYSFLNLIKIGSRPTKRSQKLSVSGLRAIPWILCWTQTRILFPVWWGVGSSWEEATARERKALIRSYKKHPVFGVFVKALGFTLAKVELPIWKIYLEQSSLSKEDKERAWKEFTEEYQKSLRCARALMGHKELLSWRPWLGESIRLRSPMVHPLNLLQVIAMQRRDADLMRVTVAGISSGMMTTG